MKDHDLQSDEEAIETRSRQDMLTHGALGQPMSLRGMKLRPPTMESMSYLWELKNYFVYRDEQGRIARNNPVLGVAEFVLVHHADVREVAELMGEKDKLMDKLREYMNGPLAGFKVLEEAMPVIEVMLSDYAAAQTELEGSAQAATDKAGKGRARAGKRPTSR